MINKAIIQRHFNRASQQYERYAFIQREIGQRLLERLDVMKIHPQTILDLGTSTGYIANLMQKRFTDAKVIGLDLAESMVRQAKANLTQNTLSFICADSERLPLRSAQFDCVISNLTLQWCDVNKVFSEVQRILKPNGLWLFSTLGPDSLFELRQSWQQIDDDAHTLDFTDLHDIGDAIVKAKLCDPVMEMEKILFQYPTLPALLADIRGIGAQNIHAQQPRGLMGKQRWQSFVKSFEQQFYRGNLYPLTYEVVYGHAWKPEQVNTVVGDETGTARFPLAYLRRQGHSE